MGFGGGCFRGWSARKKGGEVRGGGVHIYMMEKGVHVMEGENIVKGILFKQNIRFLRADIHTQNP